MRYLIIDCHELANPKMGIYGKVLTAEESLAKFKEIAEQYASVIDNFREDNWEEYSKTL